MIAQPDARGAMGGGNYSVTGGIWNFVSVVQTPGLPVLTVSHSGNSVIVSWPSASPGFVSQQNGNLAAGNWTTGNGFTVSYDGTNKCITITSPTGTLFFRLAQPQQRT